MKKFLIILIISFSVYSENIILKNGQNIQGKVLGHDSDSITVSVDNTTRVIPKSTVHKVVFTSGNSETQKISKDKTKKKKTTNTNVDDDDELISTDETADDRQLIHQKLIILQQTQEKYEKKVMRIRSKIQKLKQKLKQKKSDKSDSSNDEF